MSLCQFLCLCFVIVFLELYFLSDHMAFAHCDWANGLTQDYSHIPGGHCRLSLSMMPLYWKWGYLLNKIFIWHGVREFSMRCTNRLERLSGQVNFTGIVIASVNLYTCIAFPWCYRLLIVSRGERSWGKGMSGNLDTGRVSLASSLLGILVDNMGLVVESICLSWKRGLALSRIGRLIG